MLHAAHIRSPNFRPSVFRPGLCLLPDLALRLALLGSVVVGASAAILGSAVAAPLPGKPGFRSHHAVAHAVPGPHRWAGDGAYHRQLYHGRRYAGTRLYPGPFGFPLEAGLLAGLAAVPQPPVRDAEASPRPGPISFADLPASPGIRATPASPPLFMRVAGRQVVADDGERILWRAGPDGTVRQVARTAAGQRRAGERMAAAGPVPGAPKIIVIRP